MRFEARLILPLQDPVTAARTRDTLDLGAPEAGGCSSTDTMREAARQAGQSELLDQYARDYPLD